MPYVRNGVVHDTRPLLDPHRIPEALFAIVDSIYFFFVTIISPEAASTWIASKKKKNDDIPGMPEGQCLAGATRPHALS